MAFIKTDDGCQLFFRDWGRGEPLIFVASQSVSSDLWSYNIPFFADHGFRCIAFDRRGHGRSDAPAGGYDIDTLVGDLACVVERLALRDVVLIGHSLGGAEVLRYAASARGRERVRCAVALSPIGPCMVKKPDNPSGFEPSLFEQQCDVWRQDFPRWVGEGARPFFTPDASTELVQWGVSLLLQTPLYVHLRVARVSFETDLRPDLTRIEVPTLFVHGERDASVPFAFGQAAAAQVRDSRFIGYADAAHGLPITHAAQLHRDVLAFLRR